MKRDEISKKEERSRFFRKIVFRIKLKRQKEKEARRRKKNEV